MARIRSVKPELCESEVMAGLPAEVERTFVRLWTHCDDEGRAKDNPKLLKAALYPLHDDVGLEEVDEDLNDLARVGLIVRYEVEGKRYLSVSHWDEHQHPQRRTPSKLPEPSDGTAIHLPPPRMRTRAVLGEDSRRTRGGLASGVVVGEGDVDGGEREIPTAEVVPVDSPPATPAKSTYRPSFEAFNRVYPRKAKKGEAARAYEKARKIATDDALLLAAAAYAKACTASGIDLEFIPYPASWLNGRCWEDPLPVPRKPKDDRLAPLRRTAERHGIEVRPWT